MYPNLRAEMKRNNITQYDLRKVLNLSTSTINVKMNRKSDWELSEAKKIRDSFFPNLTLDYLFAYNS